MKRSVVTVVALAALICSHAQRPEPAEEPSRGELEAAFIGSLRFADVSRSPFAEVDTAALEPYAGDAYVLPGGTYQNKDITRNVYFSGAGRLLPVWDASMPSRWPICSSILRMCTGRTRLRSPCSSTNMAKRRL